ncbi:MAG: putative rane transporter protein [Ignavibacteria bacterium]|nr:putative rane transporter protein [Ignavibacteria bacterium]
MDFLNSFSIYLPIAEMQFNVILLLVIGFCVGVLGGFFGVGGGWIVTPALNLYGFPMDYAIGTDITHIFGKSIVATKIHSGLGNVDWKLGFYSIACSVVGVEAGAQIIMYFKDIFGSEGLDVIVRWSYVALLLILGSLMLVDYFYVSTKPEKAAKLEAKKYKSHPEKEKIILHKTKKEKESFPHRLQKMRIPPMISFPTSGIKEVSFWVVFTVFFIAGVLQGFLGVGGGFIKMPAMIYLLGTPTVIAVGTDLFNVLVTSIYGGFTYAMKGRVELIAALIMCVGGAFGAVFGSTATKYVRGYGIRLLFAIMILLAGGSIIIKQFEKPLDIPFLNALSGYLVVGSSIVMTLLVLGKLLTSYLKRKALEKSFDPAQFE